MSAFGKEQSAGGSVKKLYTGAANFKVVGINPTKEELEAIYGRELNFTPEYIGTTKVTDSDGEREVAQIRLDFFLTNEDESLSTKIQFYVADTHHKSQTGKFKVINSFGRDTWLDQESIQSKQVPSNMTWYNSDGVKVAKRGEVELISFLVNLLNLPWDTSKVSDPSECYARIDKAEWTKIFAGDVSLLKGLIDSTNNKIGVLLGVKTKGDGKLVQTAYNRSTLRQYVIAGTRADKFKYLLKDMDEAVAAGAFGNVDFGPRDLSIREHSIKPTAISAGNTDQEDIFAVAEASPQDVADSDDWLNG